MAWLALLWSISAAVAQENIPPPNQPPPPPLPTFTQQDLDRLLAPIALYPDPLLSQILMAATYPLEVVEAARWSGENPGLQGDAAVQAVESMSWDPSVKSLVAFPQILAMMDQNLSWTEQLGDAFLSAQPQVMDTVQELRQKAYAAGNLRSTDQLQVEPEGQTIEIEPANPEVIYVPYYDPNVIYGAWWWAAPPYYWPPFPGYYVGSAGFAWGIGIAISNGFFFGAFDWGRHSVDVVRVNNYYYAPANAHHRPPNMAPGAWQHDPFHRRGIFYRDPALRQRFRAGAGAPEMRSDFRGRGTVPGARGSAPSVNMPNVAAPSSVPRAAVVVPGTAPVGHVTPRTAPAVREPHAFEGIGPGAETRGASERGHASFRTMEAPRSAPPSAPSGGFRGGGGNIHGGSGKGR